MTAKANNSSDTKDQTSNVTSMDEARNRAGKTRVRLPVSVNYDGESLDELWLRLPIVLDGIVAGNQGKTENAMTLIMIAQCADIDADWLWEQNPKISNKLVSAFTNMKDPTHEPEWDGNTLTLKKPLDIEGKKVVSVVLKEPTTRDLMDESSQEKTYELVARLIGLKTRDIRDMDYLHDYRDLVDRVNSFRNT